ncbi:MAG: DUF4105 domain-containing protein, partial [Phycisphaerae bacterium]|nr:DUF4105 domain-containing protein [Phycisphaerae bacterium]
MSRGIALLTTLLLGSFTWGQSTTLPEPRWRAFLITFSPGPALWERFGHNALLIYDSQLDRNYCYDFGNFDFEQPGFLRRFILRQMLYSAERKDVEQLLSEYRLQNRQITGQSLQLSSDQAEQLWRNLELNVREDRKFYAYDYYQDNCSTRIRDHLDRVTHGALRAALESLPTGTTYRHHTRLGLAYQPLLLAGVDFLLSTPADRTLSAWEECFLPERLAAHVRTVKLDGAALVLSERQMNPYLDETRLIRVPAREPPLLAWGGGLGLVIGVALASCGLVADRSAVGRGLAGAVWAGWGLLAGVAGSLLLLMWLLTDHRATYANLNLLLVSPLSLAWLVLGPLAARGRAVEASRWLAAGLVAMAILATVIKGIGGS